MEVFMGHNLSNIDDLLLAITLSKAVVSQHHLQTDKNVQLTNVF